MQEFESGATRLSYYDRGVGHPIVLLHGFPDTWRTWDATSNALVDNGYRVLVLAMRGYEPSGIPGDGNYSIPALANDIAALLNTVSIGKSCIIGHDWGASAAYAFAALFPDRVDRLITLANPPLTVFPSGWRELVARPHNVYLSWGPLSAWWLRHQNFGEIARLYKKWSPSWSVPDCHLKQVGTALEPPERTRAAVDYYADNSDNTNTWRAFRQIDVPTLMIYGSDEPKSRQSAYDQALAVTGAGSRLICIEGVGHWPHLEAPERCLTAVLEFLDHEN